MMARGVSSWLILVSLVTVGFAQEAPVSTIETEGAATLHTPPTYAEFWLHAEAKGATALEAVERLLKFEPRLRADLETRELAPASLSFTGVAIPNIQEKKAGISAQLVFNLANFANAEDAPQQLAVLCDKLTALAGALQCRVQGPELGTHDRESIEAGAISQAVETAYPAAQAAAQLMNASLSAVGKLTIESLIWNSAPDIKATQPDVRCLTCTAKVKVTYTFGAP